jgi:hypothetical protein
MDELARRFARAAQERGGLRYSPALRQLALEYAYAAAGNGRTQRQIAESLGLSEVTLCRWQKARAATAPVHEVVVVGGESAASVVLVMPSGVRVEGLTVRELVAVLGALG